MHGMPTLRVIPCGLVTGTNCGRGGGGAAYIDGTAVTGVSNEGINGIW